MLCKQSISSVKFCKALISVRLLSNVTIHQRNKTNSNNGQFCTKITNFCIKTSSTKAKKTVFYKTFRPKKILRSIGKKVWPVFNENKLKVVRYNITTECKTE